MKRFFESEVGAVVVWVLGALLLAALTAPWLYRAGMQLAAAAEARELPGLLEWLGAACGRSKFGRFFDRSLMLVALVTLPGLIAWLRRIRGTHAARLLGTVRLPWTTALGHWCAGVVIAGGMLWLAGVVLENAGAYTPRANAPAIGRLLPKFVLPAVIVSPIEEWLFRGLLLGLWLRLARPAVAVAGTSIVFAFLHFLKPAEGTVIADPAHPLAGVELLGNILLHFTDPVFFVADFATLLGIGLILAWARLRTGALWFSIGLHAGWIAAFKAFNLLHRGVDDHPWRPWWIGDSLRSGLLPMFTLVLTAVICHYLWRWWMPARPAAITRA